jgi:hypothetical protein
MTINFSNIRAHNGSQEKGFEELVCQLAHLQKPERAKTFVRKEGAGGDAGIECYWVLEDDSEIGWQAKYFTGKMGSSQWGQIDKSFKTALEKHPKLKKYIVSLPFDRNDSRKTGRGGVQVVSVQDEWNNLIQSWKELAEDRGRKIEYEFWGKHELTLFLTTDNPLYSGRVLYWFDEPVLSFETFNLIAGKSQKSLGERYTQELHVDLPITESFDALSSNPEWWKRIEKEKKQLIEKKELFFRDFLEKNQEFLNEELADQLKEVCSELITLLSQCLKCKSLIENLDEIKNLCKKLQGYQEKIIREDKKELFYGSKFRNERSKYSNFFYEYRIFYNFLNSKAIEIAKVGAALLYGDAGIGKSHLLCDLCLNRLKNQLPTIFLLGQHYESGNPINTLKTELDLPK